MIRAFNAIANGDAMGRPEMLAGGIDLMVEVPPTSLSEFQGGNFTVHEQAGPHVWFLILNLREGPFVDKAVRQAANYAVNKTALVEDVQYL